MSISIKEFNQLKEENKMLKKQISKLNKRVEKSVNKTEIEYLLNVLIPDVEEEYELNYEVFIDLCCPYLDFKGLIKVITSLLKTNRNDLAFLFSQKYISENYIKDNEIKKEEFQQLLNEFIRVILSQVNVQGNHLKLFFEIISFKRDPAFVPVYQAIFNKYTHQLTKFCFAEHTDFWLLKLLYNVWSTDIKLLSQYFEFLNGHWDLIYNWISEESLFIWEILVEASGNNVFKGKLAKKREDYDYKINGLKLNEIPYKDNVNDYKSKFDNDFTNEWRTVSDLRSYGYEVTNKTDEQRRAALNKALKHMPVSKIVSHIQWLLKNSYRKHRLRGDYSKSIIAYETDLDYLKSYFSS